MLSRTLRTLTLAVALALGAPLVATAAAPYGPGVPVVPPYVAPTAEEAVDLAYMREEEKFARDLYLNFAEAWGETPFAYIANAEQSHMDAMLRLLRKYRLADPAAGNLVGEFGNPDLQVLYTVLLQRGQAGKIDALKVGGLVEEADLVDLGISMSHTMKADLRAAYASLACGSRNHLRAFAAELRAITGQSYVAQSMSQAAVDAVLAQPWERCGRTW
ncbi:MAG: DUF2202 domain-containing protein [Lysobacter sp.]|nr:DUF2202 domain-containing protein [Lysobacter sp.]